MNLKIKKLLSNVLATVCLFGLFPKGYAIVEDDNYYVERFVSHYSEHYTDKGTSSRRLENFFRARSANLSAIIAKIEYIWKKDGDSAVLRFFQDELPTFYESEYEIGVALKKSHSCREFLKNFRNMRLAYQQMAISCEHRHSKSKSRHSTDLSFYVPDMPEKCDF